MSDFLASSYDALPGPDAYDDGTPDALSMATNDKHHDLFRGIDRLHTLGGYLVGHDGGGEMVMDPAVDRASSAPGVIGASSLSNSLPLPLRKPAKPPAISGEKRRRIESATSASASAASSAGANGKSTHSSSFTNPPNTPRRMTDNATTSLCEKFSALFATTLNYAPGNAVPEPTSAAVEQMPEPVKAWVLALLNECRVSKGQLPVVPLTNQQVLDKLKLRHPDILMALLHDA